ncbi:MAG: alpha/beta hydrolase [Planctomycetota bacterium]|jgi:alpha-beta hydrolase superfamily lysophospholipase
MTSPTDDIASRPRVRLAHQPAEPGLPQRVPLELPDGYVTSVHVWPTTSTNTKPPVLYMHGIQSHPGWFSRSAEALWRAGHTVYQVTRRGSGDNICRRGHATSVWQILNDTVAAHRFVLADSGADACHLLGVSWGGKLLAAYLATWSRALPAASLTLISPGIVPRVKVPVRTLLGVSACVGAWPRRQFDIPLNDVTLFTDNEAMRDYLRGDPHRLHQGTARAFFVSRCLDWRLGRARRGSLRVPTTLLLAERDRIIDSAATQRVVERLANGQATVRYFDSCHTPEFEPDPSEFLAALVKAISDEPDGGQPIDG